VSDAEPGIARRRRGGRFVYVGPRGRPVRNPRVLERIRALAIPPAYEDVWICRLGNGHLQATGRDARGRKQYRYHPRWRRLRDADKFERLGPFAEVLPALREALAADLRRQGLPRVKVLAAIVTLLDRTLIRIGNEEYARHNSSYGLTTLRTHHVRAGSRRVEFRFRGKSGKAHAVVLSDARLARIIRHCQGLPGQLLFQYYDDDGRLSRVRSNDVNAYLRERTGLDVTAKHFRTWGATLHFTRCWDESLVEAPDLGKDARTRRCLEKVAHRLGNTPAVCRNAYLDPRVVDALRRGRWAIPPDATDVDPYEAALRAFLAKDDDA
jgi:DNA topoisomerase-1